MARVRRRSGSARSIASRVVDDTTDALAPFQTADLRRDLRDGFVGDRQSGNMRRDRDFGTLPEGMCGRQRLLPENVERGTGQLAAIEKGQQVLFDKRVTTADVHHVRAVGKPR